MASLFYRSLIITAIWLPLAFSPDLINAQESACPDGLTPVVSQDVVDALQSGQPQFLSCVVIIGDVRLEPGSTHVPQLLLINSTIEGSLDFSFAEFSGPFRLNSSIVKGDVSFVGTTFLAEVNWSGAKFQDDDVEASPLLNATGARFRASADLRAENYGAVDFTNSSFSDRVLVNGAIFNAEARFQSTIFEAGSSFRGAVFLDTVSFLGVTSLGMIDLARARFYGQARFERSSLTGTLSLRDATFSCDLSFNEVTAAQIDLARIEPSTVSSTDINNRTCNQVGGRAELHMSALAIDAIEIPLGVAGQIRERESRVAVLKVLEGYKRRGGDVSLANKAFFQRKKLETAARSGPEGWAWQGVEYSTGYLVKPARPMAVIAFVLVVGTTVRLAFSYRTSLRAMLVGLNRDRGVLGKPPDGGSASPSPAGLESEDERLDASSAYGAKWAIMTFLIRLLRSAKGAIGNTFRPKPPELEFDESKLGSYLEAIALWTEYLVQKTFIVLVLISLGNANQTIHEIITSIG